MKKTKLTLGKMLLVSLMILFALTGPAAAKEWTVGTGEADFQTIQDAVAGAADGDLVRIGPGTYTFQANLSVGKSVSLIGEDPETVILDLGGFSILPKKENFVLKNVTLTNGSNGINLQSAAVDALIENCIFDGMMHKDGIKLAKDGAVLKDSVIKNMSGFTNAVYITGNNVEFSGNKLSGLTGNGNAARIISVENANGVRIEGNEITNNAGEAIRLWKKDTANAVITRNVISGNTQKGIYFYNAGENNAVYLNDLFDNTGGNVASYGTLPTAAVFNSPSPLTLTYDGTVRTGDYGNYWGNDYNGVDADGNGIGTTPKSIMESFSDNAPLLSRQARYTTGSENPEQPEQPDPNNPDPEQPGQSDNKNQGGTVSMTTTILPSLSVSFSIDSLDFGSLTAGQNSAFKELEMTNNGGCDIIVTAEVTASSDDLYKQGLWMDDSFWPDYEKKVAMNQTTSSELVLKVPTDYESTGQIDGTLILWVEADMS